MNILALDVGEFCGFSTYIDGAIESGVEHLKHKGSESAGFKYLRFTELLKRLYEIGHFDLIVYEKPHGLQGHAIESASGYITRIHEFCAVRNIEYRGESPATIKKFFTGNGRASKEQMGLYYNFQDEAMEKADENLVDAYALLKFTLNDLGIQHDGKSQ